MDDVYVTGYLAVWQLLDCALLNLHVFFSSSRSRATTFYATTVQRYCVVLQVVSRSYQLFMIWF